MTGSSTPFAPSSTNRSKQAWFTTTHWSVILGAAHHSTTQAQVALEKLCKIYWYPLYAFARRSGTPPLDAEDLVQSFFAVCLEKRYLNAADQNKGRFRTFFLTAFKRFAANEWDKARTQKRGGAAAPLALDSLTAEERYAIEPADKYAPDKLYERRWALTLLATVLQKLEKEEIAAGRRTFFDTAKEFLSSRDRGTPYSELASRLGMSESALKVAIHRLRKRYRALLEREISNTVSRRKRFRKNGAIFSRSLPANRLCFRLALERPSFVTFPSPSLSSWMYGQNGHHL